MPYQAGLAKHWCANQPDWFAQMGLLAKHRDIDFHIYTPTLDIAQSFAAIAQIARNPKIAHIEFSANL